MPNRQSAPSTIPITTLDFLPAPAQQLPCGINIYCAPPRALGVLRLDLFWTQGTAVQQQTAQARASTQLRFSGTKTKSAEVILDDFESWGASFSGETSLLTSGISVKSIKENLFHVLPTLIDVLENATYPQSEIDIYKGIEQASLLRKMQTPGYWSQRLCLESVYGVTSPDTLFTNTDDFDRLNQQLLLDYTRKNQVGRDATLFISGDYDENTLSIINSFFTQLSLTETKADETTFPTPQNEVKTIKKHLANSNQISLCMAKHFQRVSQDDFPKLSLLNLFLGGFFGSRLMQDLREEKGLTYGIGSNISLSGNGHTWMITGEMNSDNAALTQDSIRDILVGLWKNPPHGEELEKAKLYYGGQLRGSLDGPFSEPARIQFLLKAGYSPLYYQQALQTVWATNSDSLSELAYNYLNPDSFTIALAGATADKI